MTHLTYSFVKTPDGDRHIAIRAKELASFNSSILGLGGIAGSASGSWNSQFDAIAAVFDLEDFTKFSDRSGAEQNVPEFLEKFLEWFFIKIKDEIVKGEADGKVLLWSYLPFFAKFMGDGVLLLWKTPDGTMVGGDRDIGNILVLSHNICRAFSDEFLLAINARVPAPPQRLRCGIARGNIIVIGGGKDFVGPCINIASRLQKLGKLSFAVHRTGIDPDKCLEEPWRERYVLMKTFIRGIAERQLVLLDQIEFNALPESEKKFFSVP